MPSNSAATLFAALGDETRLELVARLQRQGSMSISRLSSGFAVSRQAITKHLLVLEGAGLASTTRRGRQSVWHLERERLEVARTYLEQISRQWDEKIERLRELVEDDEMPRPG